MARQSKTRMAAIRLMVCKVYCPHRYTSGIVSQLNRYISTAERLICRHKAIKLSTLIPLCYTSLHSRSCDFNVSLKQTDYITVSYIIYNINAHRSQTTKCSEAFNVFFTRCILFIMLGLLIVHVNKMHRHALQVLALSIIQWSTMKRLYSTPLRDLKNSS